VQAAPELSAEREAADAPARCQRMRASAAAPVLRLPPTAVPCATPATMPAAAAPTRHAADFAFRSPRCRVRAVHRSRSPRQPRRPQEMICDIRCRCPPGAVSLADAIAAQPHL